MKMKKTTLGMMMAATLLASSCLSEEQNLEPKNEGSQKGKIVLDLNTDASFSEQTRALNEADYRNTANYTVQLLRNDQVLTECMYSEVANEFPKELEPGEYVVKAFYGVEHPYSRDEFRVEGSRSVVVSKGGTSNAVVSCLPTCGKLTVVFDAAMATYYDSYSVAYKGASAFGGGAITWAKADTDPFYVRLSADGETLTYTINVTAKEDYAHVDADGNKQTSGSVEGQFTLTRNGGHRLIVKPIYTATTDGGLKLEITIDNSVNPREETIVVPVDWL